VKAGRVFCLVAIAAGVACGGSAPGAPSAAVGFFFSHILPSVRD